MKKMIFLLFIISLFPLFSVEAPDFLKIIESFNISENIIIYTKPEAPQRDSGNEKRSSKRGGSSSEATTQSNKDAVRQITEESFDPELYEITGYKTGLIAEMNIWIVDVKSRVDKMQLPIKRAFIGIENQKIQKQLHNLETQFSRLQKFAKQI